MNHPLQSIALAETFALRSLLVVHRDDTIATLAEVGAENGHDPARAMERAEPIHRELDECEALMRALDAEDPADRSEAVSRTREWLGFAA